MIRSRIARLTGILTLLALAAILSATATAAPALASGRARQARRSHHAHVTRCHRARRKHHGHVRRCRTLRRSRRRGHHVRKLSQTFSGTSRGRASSAIANPFGQAMFGVASGGAIQNEAPVTLASDLTADQAAGAKWIRVDINWAQIQAGGPSSYDWTSIDAVVRGAEARGMSVLGLILYTPSWDRPANSAATYGPSSSSYATFAHAAAAHYSALGVHAYEIWNEENTTAFWTPSPSPKYYAALLKAAYPAIKAADSAATVVTGGLSPATTQGGDYAPTDFLKGVYANGAGRSFDAVGIHPYCWPAIPAQAYSWSAWYQMYGTSTSLRSIMVAHGDSAKHIWATEFGAPTGGPAGTYVSQTKQATMIQAAFKAWSSYSWAGPLFIYQGRDEGTSATTNQNFFGFRNYNGTPKPAFGAYQAAVASL
jgi:hypothetical protein